MTTRAWSLRGPGSVGSGSGKKRWWSLVGVLPSGSESFLHGGVRQGKVSRSNSSYASS